tara:strand:- start:296 stop:1033 length:738 start_codon:yes stop_codon:yes gene_type:complete
MANKMPKDIIIKIPSLKKLTPILFLILGLVFFFIYDFQQFFELKTLELYHGELKAWATGLGVRAWLIFICLYAVLVAISVPGATLMTVISGLVFGPFLGGILAIIGATVGAVIIFLAARYAFSDFFRFRVGSIPEKIEDAFKENALIYLLILRLIPIFPFWFVNLAPAFLKISIRVYSFATLVGIIPAAFIYSILGDRFGLLLKTNEEIYLGIIFEPRFLMPLVALAMLIFLPIVFKKLKTRSGF